jgi:hypothetical protein
MIGDELNHELNDSTKAFPSLFHRNLIRRVTNVTDNVAINTCQGAGNS